MKNGNKDPRTYAIIGAAMEVHNKLGHGFLEPVYQEALMIEFARQDIPHQREVNLPILYKETQLNTSYRADFICYDNIIVEIKAITLMSGTEESQIINYLKATGLTVGLLINFGEPSLKYKRFVFSKTSPDDEKNEV